MLILAIAGREMRSYFTTTVGWIVLAAFLFIAGFFWNSIIVYYVTQSADVLSNPYAQDQMNVTDYLLSPFFGNLSLILLMIVCPAITMGTYAEEVKSKSIELLLTSPVSTAEIIVGKFLGSMGVVCVMLLFTAYVPITLYLWWNQPDWGTVAAGYLAVILVCGSIISIGSLFSSMTSSSIVALLATFAASLIIYLMGAWASNGDTDTLIGQLSITTHTIEMMRGAIKLSDVVYFMGFIALFQFATHQRVEGYRWR
jgi:ABC-2 type transport system permease protein